MKDIKFYDTCSLLVAGERLFEEEEHFIISSITFKELERIKTANNKDLDVKYAARILLHLFEKYPDRYEVVIHDKTHLQPIIDRNFEITNDMRVLSDAIWCNNNIHVDSTIFVTNDLSLRHIANLFFGHEMIEKVTEDCDSYTGYKEVIFYDEESMAEFYQNMSINHFNLEVGQYLILYSADSEDKKPIDIRVWTGETHRNITTQPFNSKWFGKINPYKGDIY